MSNYYYKGIRVNAFGIPVSKKSHKSQNQQISKSSNNFPITKKQLAYYNSSFNSPFQKSSPKNLILRFGVIGKKSVFLSMTFMFNSGK